MCSAPTTLTTNGNLQTAYTENLSPYVRQHLGSYADSESRYVFSSVTTMLSWATADTSLPPFKVTRDGVASCPEMALVLDED